jgi:short-subunit dehydrogenase
MAASGNPLAVVTGASTGIGYHLARCCRDNGFDLLIAADEYEIHEAAERLRQDGTKIEAVVVDLADLDGVEQLCAALKGRPVDLLLANAGHGLGKAFLDQDYEEIQHVIDTNVSGTVYLVHQVARNMRARGQGRILITGSIAGHLPEPFQAVYAATKAFLNSFAAALRNELQDSGVTVTCLKPGATETEFFERADLMDTKAGQAEKANPAEVAQAGFDALMRGDDEVIPGWTNKAEVAASGVLSESTVAAQQRKGIEPGSGRRTH